MKNIIQQSIIFFALLFTFSLPALADTEYYHSGTMVSENLLSGADVSDITDFSVTASVPAGTSLKVSFSQDRSLFYSSTSTKGGWDICSDGTTDIDISGLGWSGGALYYKLFLETTDPATSSEASAIELTYDGSAVPAPGNPRYSEGYFVSDDLLASSTGASLSGSDYFAYGIRDLPSGTHVYAQFAVDIATTTGVYYSSDGTAWGWDELEQGDHFNPETALSLLALNWRGETSFYYKLKFTSTVDNKTTPEVERAGLLQTAASFGHNAGAKGADPILYLDFDEGYGGVAHDSSGNNNDGLLYPGTTGDNTSSSSMWTKDGKVKGAMEFDGTDDWIDVGDMGTDINTIAFWIKSDSLSESIIDLDGGTHTISVSSGVISASGFSSPAIYIDGIMSQTIDTNWHHIIIKTSTAIDANNTDIGRISSNYFDGSIDEVKIWNFALTEDEIKTEYNQGKSAVMGSRTAPSSDGAAASGAGLDYCIPGDTATCSPPVLELKMDEKQGTTTYDTSGQGNDGVFVNTASSPTWKGAGYCKYGNCLEFDGSDDYVDVGDLGVNIATIEFWTKPETNSEYIVDLDGGTHYVRINSGTVAATGFSSPNIYVNGQESTTANTGWQHIAITTATDFDANNIDIAWAASNYFTGLIDDIKIYDYARTPAQIAWDYNGGKPIAHWAFDECSGGTIHDESPSAGSGQAANGTLYLGTSGVTATGTCASSSDSFWYNGRLGALGKSGSFDGTDDYIDIGDTGLNINSISF